MEKPGTSLKSFTLFLIVTGTLAFPSKRNDGNKLDHVIRNVMVTSNDDPADLPTPGHRAEFLEQILNIARNRPPKRNIPYAYAGVGGGNPGRRIFRGRRGMAGGSDVRSQLHLLSQELQAVARDLDNYSKEN